MKLSQGRKHWRNAAHWLASRLMFIYLSYAAQTPCLGMALPSVSKRKCPTDMPQTSLMELVL